MSVSVLIGLNTECRYTTIFNHTHTQKQSLSDLQKQFSRGETHTLSLCIKHRGKVGSLKNVIKNCL